MLAKVYVVQKPSHAEQLTGKPEKLVFEGTVVGLDNQNILFAAGAQAQADGVLKGLDPARLSVSVASLPQGA